MPYEIRLEHVGLLPQGGSVTCSLGEADKWVVVGRSGSGKTRFLQIVSQEIDPPQGSLNYSKDAQEPEGEWVVFRLADPLANPKAKTLALTKAIQEWVVVKPCRTTKGNRKGGPQRMVESRLAPPSPSVATELLVSLGLWEVRNEPVANLTPGQRAALQTLPLLLLARKDRSLGTDSLADRLRPLRGVLLVVDEVCDRMDRWAREIILDAIDAIAEQGATVVVVSQLTEVASRCSSIIAMRELKPVFVGSIAQFVKRSRPVSFEVCGERMIGLRAMVEPFAVKVEEIAGGIRFEAYEGQELAAKLMLEGYGDVKYVVMNSPRLSDALSDLA
jgi:energy-coupling factor transporter ATP-binding protein EcfA2